VSASSEGGIKKFKSRTVVYTDEYVYVIRQSCGSAVGSEKRGTTGSSIHRCLLLATDCLNSDLVCLIDPSIGPRDLTSVPF
jgi:hypothetical protein